MKKQNIAIIGAGMSGLIAALNLQDTFNVHLFEKARGISGRMSTRYAENYEFDHGTPYITARSEKFKIFVHQLTDKNIITQWLPKIQSIGLHQKPFKRTFFEPHYVGFSRMNDIAKYIYQQCADKITLYLDTEIKSVTQNKHHITLTDKNEINYELFDKLIITAPANQAYYLLPHHIPYRDLLQQVELNPLYCMMIGTPDKLKGQTGLYICDDMMIDKIIINSSKPNRLQHGTSLVVQSTSQWAMMHIDADIPNKQQELTEQTFKLLHLTDLNIDYHTTHRWRYAKVSKPLNEPFLWDTNSQIGICADWCQATENPVDIQENVDTNQIQGVESAFLSAINLVEHLRKSK
jgi:hypothetical protein